MSRMAGCLNIAGFTVLTAIAQLGTTTSRVIILAYSMPIWACLMALPILGERLNRMRAVALVLCVAGIAVLISPLAASGVPSGLLFALAAGVSWAAGTIYLKWARIAADPIATAAWQLVAALVVTAATVPVFEGGFQLWPIELQHLPGAPVRRNDRVGIGVFSLVRRGAAVAGDDRVARHAQRPGDRHRRIRGRARRTADDRRLRRLRAHPGGGGVRAACTERAVVPNVFDRALRGFRLSARLAVALGWAAASSRP